MSQDPLPLVMCLMPMTKVFAHYLHPFGPHLESSFGGFVVVSGHLDAKLWSLKVYCTGILLYIHISSHSWSMMLSVWSSTPNHQGHHKCGLFRKVCRSAETEVNGFVRNLLGFAFLGTQLNGDVFLLAYGCSGWNYKHHFLWMPLFQINRVSSQVVEWGWFQPQTSKNYVEKCCRWLEHWCFFGENDLKDQLVLLVLEGSDSVGRWTGRIRWSSSQRLWWDHCPIPGWRTWRVRWGWRL